MLSAGLPVEMTTIVAAVKGSEDEEDMAKEDVQDVRSRTVTATTGKNGNSLCKLQTMKQFQDEKDSQNLPGMTPSTAAADSVLIGEMVTTTIPSAILTTEKRPLDQTGVERVCGTTRKFYGVHLILTQIFFSFFFAPLFL